jgi:hypothetical protein
MNRLTLVLLVACSSSPSPPATPPPSEPAIAAPIAIDRHAARAEIDAAPPVDAMVIDDELANAPASMFRFNSTGENPRLETWTLRHVGERGMMLVERVKPVVSKTLYVGTASGDANRLTLALAAGTDKLALTCRRAELQVADAKAKRVPSPNHRRGKCDLGVWSPEKTTPIAVFECKHPDFAAPMYFAAAPGIEYLYVDVHQCLLQGGGYRAIAADGSIAKEFAPPY